MFANRNALEIAKAYITAVENRDRNAIDGTLADDVQHVFPLAAGGAENLQALFLGKEEVLGYIDSLFAKFASLTWPGAEWTLSEDGTRAFVQARGDAIVRHSNAPYQNTYIVRFDVNNDRITKI